jgi:hypothetical protein
MLVGMSRRRNVSDQPCSGETVRESGRLRSMSIEDWWPKLMPTTREWLIENDGDAVPAKILVEITAAGGSVASNAWWVGQAGPYGFYISDEATDWIEAAGNGEVV